MPALTQKHSAALRTITPLTRDTFTLRFDLTLDYAPGQSIQIAFPGDPKKRFYSISSYPEEGPFVDITVKSEAGSPLRKAIENLKRGDSLELEGPFAGALALPDPVRDSLVFIAAGTGAAPFRSMIGSLIDDSTPSDFWLLHSVRSQKELLFHEDFSTWSGENKNFHYVPTITKDFEDTWTQETGRIGEALLRKHVAAHPCTYFLCGPFAFVNDMEKLLKDILKISQDNIRREKW
jgi:ferredoxin-NADP reductase